jgi:hypothetical protein
MVERGAAFGWFFQYVMYGKDPDPTLVPTPEQRSERRDAVLRYRREKPVLVFDFWNDGDSVQGCLAWGRKYVHITANGNVEPCVFVHFALDNIRDKSLEEILNSECFKDGRSRQPFGDDLRRPCPVIDHPHELKDLVEKHKMFANDGASMAMIQEMHPTVIEQAEAYRKHLEERDAGGCTGSCHTCAQAQPAPTGE